MSILKDAGERLAKTYSSARMEMKIRDYSAETRKLFNELGVIIYECKKKGAPVNEDRLNEIIGSIDAVKSRIVTLKKHKAALKGPQSQAAAAAPVEARESKGYIVLNKKEDDLKVTRTEDGISILRFCPKCGAGSAPGTEGCEKCGRLFHS